MSYNKWQKNPVNTARQRINDSDRLYLFSNILRIPALYTLARIRITPETFDKYTEMPYAVLWRAAINISAKDVNQQLPTDSSKLRKFLELEMRRISESAPTYITGPTGSFDVISFIDALFDIDEAQLDETYTKDLLTKFLEEREAWDPLQRFMDSMGDNILPTDLSKRLDSTRDKINQISAIGLSPVQDAITGDWWTQNKLAQVPANFAPIDAATDGGPALGEVLTLMAGTGMGKTMITLQLAVNGARYQLLQAKKGLPSGYWFVCGYEEAVSPNIRRRVMSYASNISFKNTLKNMTSLNDLSTSDNLKQYEKQKWVEQLRRGDPVAGERERYQAAIEQLGDRLKLVDMSGALNPAFGTGGVDEIAQILTDYTVKGFPPVGVVIDYAGLVVKRYMAAKNHNVESEFHFLDSFINDVRIKIAARFNCIVWVAHQLHGDSSTAAPTVRQHHSRARGARNFCDNANYAFNLGTKDEATNCLMITCTKHRRSDAVKDVPIVRIDGDFNCMIPEDARFALDASQRRIVDHETQKIYKDDQAINAQLKAKRATRVDVSLANPTGFEQE